MFEKRKQLLYLTHRVPFPPNRGDRIRTYNILKYLSSRCDVWLGCLADETVQSEALAELRWLCRQVAIVPLQRGSRWGRAIRSFARGRSITEGIFECPGLARVVDSWSKEIGFDAALASSSGLAQYLRRGRFSKFVDLIDVDSQKWVDYSANSHGIQKWIYQQEGRRLRRYEIELAESTDGLTVVSEPEAQLFREFCPWAPIQAIPNGVDVDFFRPGIGQTIDAADARDCVFVGALDYRPNVDGVVWFAREVWPSIRRVRSQANLRLVGRKPTNSVQQLSDIDGVEVVGTVPDVRPYLSNAAVAVAPLIIARGVQNKVLEALAMQKAVVASPGPLVGLGCRDGEHLVLADTNQQWIDRIVELLDDPVRREAHGLAGHNFVTSCHRWDRCLQPFDNLLGLTDIETETTNDLELQAAP